MSDSDADEYVYLGTPLQGSDQVALPVNQQTVRDAAGRQRLHGAFTGGYSAGFYNSEGFNPSTFTSSRGNRASQRQQNVSDFLDEDELEELREKGLQAKAEYDTFSTENAEKSQAQAADQAAARHGLNLFPEEALKPVVSSIGVKLLQKMGWKQLQPSYRGYLVIWPCSDSRTFSYLITPDWRCLLDLFMPIRYHEGRGLGFQESSNLEQMGFDMSAAEQQDEEPAKRVKRRRWGPMTGLQIQNSVLTQLNNKKNTYGLGFDPYANSEEFRIAKKRLREETSQKQRHAVDSKGRRARGTAFGASALEESDVYGGELEDYANDADPHAGMHFEVVSSDEDAGGGGGGRGRGDSPKRVEGSAATVLLKARQGTMGRDSFIEGYVRGAMQQPQAVESTPVPPRCRPAAHRFKQPCSKLYGALRQQPAGPASTAAASTAPVPVPPPADRELKQRIDLAAASVARGGNEMLEFLQKSHAGAQEHSFLSGGDGAQYFHYRAQQIRDALNRATTAVLRATVPQLQQGAAAGAGAGALQRSQGQAQQAAAAQQEAAQRKLTVEQRRDLLAEASLAGTTAPAAHDQQWRREPQEDAGAAADARAELLAQAERVGVVRRGAALSSRFLKAGEGPADDDSAAAAPSIGGASSGMLPPTRTQSEWIPSPMLCRCWNVPRPKPSEAPVRAGGASGKELLAVPPSQRGEVYAGALPSFMKPPGNSSNSAREEPPEVPLALPPPPPRRHGRGAASAPEPASADQHLDAAAEELLASIQADMVDEVEKAAPQPEEMPFEKPLDVFNAIFNETDSEEEEPEEEEQEEAQQTESMEGVLGEGAGPSNPQAQLQRAQKDAVSSAVAALDGGNPGGRPPPQMVAGAGDGGEFMGGASNDSSGANAEQDSGGSSERDREQATRHDKKRSKPHGRKDDKEKRHKKKHKHERHGRSDKELLDDATALLSKEVLSQKVSTAEIMAVAAQLNKKSKSKKSRYKKHKHSSSKHHKRRREHSP